MNIRLILFIATAKIQKRIDLTKQKKKGENLQDSSHPTRFSPFRKVAASYSPALHCSTIGAGGLNFSVRNGKRWDPAAITTWKYGLTQRTSRLPYDGRKDINVTTTESMT